jgi:hypothetical protein
MIIPLTTQRRRQEQPSHSVFADTIWQQVFHVSVTLHNLNIFPQVCPHSHPATPLLTLTHMEITHITNITFPTTSAQGMSTCV